MLLTDNETEVDLLNYEAIAATIVATVGKNPNRPITVGLHGDWGAGKSSILNMIDGLVSNQSSKLCIKFNGWQFQGFGDAKISIIEGIVTELINNQSKLNKSCNAVKNVFKQIDWLKFASHGSLLSFNLFTGLPSVGQLNKASEVIKGVIDNPDTLTDPQKLGNISNLLTKYIKSEKSVKISEKISEFHKCFENLLKEAKIGQLIVLIDDLDRCLPDIAIETLEALRLFLFTKRTAFIIAADELMIEYSVSKHFPEISDSNLPKNYSRNYLEKLIQVPFRIPTLGETETRIYVTLLLIGEKIGEDCEEFVKLVVKAKKILQRPWLVNGLDVNIVKEELGLKFSSVKTELFISEQVSTILAKGTNGNPRQIKRFLNSLILRQKISKERGLGNQVRLTILAKLMLAERFHPKLYNQIGRCVFESNRGTCVELNKLESTMNVIENKPNDVNINNELVDSWKKSEKICEWAKLKPVIGLKDLRPYFFITKDNNEFNISTPLPDDLSNLVRKIYLLNEIIPPAEKTLLEQLSHDSAKIVFDTISTRVMQSDDFVEKPDGIYGLKHLVEEHSELQSNLLTFLDSLPMDECGTWVANILENSITSPQENKNFEILMEKWKKSKNTSLAQLAEFEIKRRSQENVE